MSVDLIGQFSELAPAVTEDTFNAVGAHPLRGDYLGKTQAGAPIFLIAIDELAYRPEIRHRHIRVAFGVSCRLNVDATQLTSQFVVVRFEGAEAELHEMFIRSVNAVMLPLTVSADAQEIESRVNRLISLFQALSVPSGREISGLWAELLCIRFSPRPADTLAHWHSDISETFDFSWNLRCAEVKSTTMPHRIHEFSLEQLISSAGGEGFIVSTKLRSSNSGLGVMDLARDIELSINNDAILREKLWSQVLLSLGSDFSNDLDRKFDVQFALQNLFVVSMSDVPSPEVPSDQRITSIRFKVDLSDLAVPSAAIGVAGLASVFG